MRLVMNDCRYLLSKALEAEGVDMGDVAVTLHAGTGVGKAAPSVLLTRVDLKVIRLKPVHPTRSHYKI